jgi:hypothetical protein
LAGKLPIEVAREMIDLAHHVADRLRMILGISNMNKNSQTPMGIYPERRLN